MNQLICCINKDRIEFIRKKKNLICLLVLIGIVSMVLLTTFFMPQLLEKAMSLTNILSDDTSLAEFMGKFFPQTLKESMGIFSSDVGVFYSLLVICLSFNLLPNEIESGKLILPLCAGYNKNIFFISKEITYSFLCAAPVFPIYVLYFFLGSNFLENNYNLESVIINGIVLAVTEFFICCFTITLSVIYKNKYIPLVNILLFVVVLPDILSSFSFAKYIPTYMLTYVYTSSEEPKLLIVPIAISVVVIAVLNIFVLNRKFSIDVDERR